MIEKIIIAMLHDVQRTRGDVFNSRSLKLTLNKVQSRVSLEGLSFLTKTMPRLGKALDRALCGQDPLNCSELRFSALPDTKLPRFLGEFFSRVLDKDGVVLPNPCVDSIMVLRQILFYSYKYKLPYTTEQEQKVLDKFKQTELDLCVSDRWIQTLSQKIESDGPTYVSRIDRNKCKFRGGICTSWDLGALGSKSISCKHLQQGFCSNKSIDRKRSSFRADPSDVNRLEYFAEVTRRARHLLSDVFALFDPKDIYPRHGPGAVATKQRLWNKYLWQNVSANIRNMYPLDEYFFVSLGHVSDTVSSLMKISDVNLPARVLLVPKDSRGPRLISCESVDNQWIQQGLGQAIRDHVESIILTKHNIHFTEQQPNQLGALLGSFTGQYSTLDLNEASDRISVALVRLLYPPHICEYLESCRSSATQLPDGQILELRKFAPMGSNLCFPILALTIWAILTAGTTDTDTRESILVYGDDVIVPSGYTADAIELLESFGLKINRDKSCTKGFFRESCGVDAFQGIDVTPLRLRTVWSSSPSASVYTSFIAYANEFLYRGYACTYELIAGELARIYGQIPGKDMNLSCPSLAGIVDNTSLKHRWNAALHRAEYQCFVPKSSSISFEYDGWARLLRYFAEHANPLNCKRDEQELDYLQLEDVEPFSTDTYTRRNVSVLRKRWVPQIPSEEIPRRDRLNLRSLAL